MPDKPATHRELWALQDRYEDFARRVYFILAFLVVANMIGFAISAYLFTEDHHRAAENKQALAEVQDSRERSMYLSCRAQNRQHLRIEKNFTRIFPRGGRLAEPLATLVAPLHHDCRARAKRRSGN